MTNISEKKTHKLNKMCFVEFLLSFAVDITKENYVVKKLFV